MSGRLRQSGGIPIGSVADARTRSGFGAKLIEYGLNVLGCHWTYVHGSHALMLVNEDGERESSDWKMAQLQGHGTRFVEHNRKANVVRVDEVVGAVATIFGVDPDDIGAV